MTSSPSPELAQQAAGNIAKILVLPSKRDSLPDITVERDERGEKNTRIILKGATAVFYELRATEATRRLAGLIYPDAIEPRQWLPSIMRYTEEVPEEKRENATGRWRTTVTEVHLHLPDPDGKTIDRLANLTPAEIGKGAFPFSSGKMRR